MYVINKTDGTIAATIQDGVVDTSYTNLYLIGKNYQSYGTLINDNFVRLLENFALPTPPTKPLTGQIWYDTTNQQLKVYDEHHAIFKTINVVYVSSTAPDVPQNGDLWYDSTKQQIKLYIDPLWKVISPIYSVDQGISGPVVSTVSDNNTGNSVTVTKMYNQDTIWAVFASANIHPSNVIDGFPNLNPGLNLATGSVLNGTATNALAIAGIAADKLMRTDQYNEAYGNLDVVNSDGIKIVAGVPLVSVAITGTQGQFTCYPLAADTLAVGMSVRVTGTAGGTGSISEYETGDKYYIRYTDGASVFYLADTLANALANVSSVTTTVGTPTGLTFIANDGKGIHSFIDSDGGNPRTTIASTIKGAPLHLSVTSAAGSLVRNVYIESDGSLNADGDVYASNYYSVGNIELDGNIVVNTNLTVLGSSDIMDLNAAETTVDNLVVLGNTLTENLQAVTSTMGDTFMDNLAVNTSVVSERITLDGSMEISTNHYINFQGNLLNAYIEGRDGNLALGTNDSDAMVINDVGDVAFAANISCSYIDAENVDLGTLVVIDGHIRRKHGDLYLSSDDGFVIFSTVISEGDMEAPYLTLTSTEQSTNLTNGALVVEGGAAVVKNLNVGGNITAADNLTANNITATNSIIGKALAANTTIGAAGTIRAADDIFAFTASDARLKDNVEILSNSLSKVNSLRGVEFDWIDAHIAHHGGEDGKFIRKHDVGVIAQEVQAIMPEAVMERDNGTLAVDYEKIIPLLIEAIKELNQEVTGLRMQLVELGRK